MSLLITGAAGFIGSHVAECLVNQGADVIGIDNFDPFYPALTKQRNLSYLTNKKNFRFINLDLRNHEAVTEFLNRARPTYIIHLAAKAGVRPSFQDPVGYMESNLSSTTHLLKWAAENRVERFLLASSSSVYGNDSSVPFRESETNLNPISPYGVSKLACEKIAKVYADTFLLPVVNLRFFTVYGPRQRPDLAIHKFMKAIYEGKEIQIFGDGRTSRDYTFISDIVAGIQSAVFYPLDFSQESFKSFNLGGNHPINLNDLILLLEEVSGKKATIKKTNLQIGDVIRTYADLTKSEEEIRFSPKIGLKEGLTLFWEWYVREEINKTPPPPPNKQPEPSSRA